MIENISAYDKLAYNEKNECALTAALKVENFKIYVLLWSKGFQRDGYCNEMLEKLEVRHKRRINDLSRYVSIDQKSHLFELKSKVRMAPNNNINEDCFALVEKWFEELDKIPTMQKIMKLVAKDENIKILFDFNYASVSNVDVTQGAGTLARATYGVNIAVAAKDHKAKSDEIVATMAHEFTHYAINMVFEDKGNPFFTGEATERKFVKIVKKCMKISLLCNKLDKLEDMIENHIARRSKSFLNKKNLQVFKNK